MFPHLSITYILFLPFLPLPFPYIVIFFLFLTIFNWTVLPSNFPFLSPSSIYPTRPFPSRSFFNLLRLTFTSSFLLPFFSPSSNPQFRVSCLYHSSSEWLPYLLLLLHCICSLALTSPSFLQSPLHPLYHPPPPTPTTDISPFSSSSSLWSILLDSPSSSLFFILHPLPPFFPPPYSSLVSSFLLPFDSTLPLYFPLISLSFSPFPFLSFPSPYSSFILLLFFHCTPLHSPSLLYFHIPLFLSLFFLLPFLPPFHSYSSFFFLLFFFIVLCFTFPLSFLFIYLFLSLFLFLYFLLPFPSLFSLHTGQARGLQEVTNRVLSEKRKGEIAVWSSSKEVMPSFTLGKQRK